MKYSVGRGDNCLIKINDPTVSDVHCFIQKLENGGFLVEDNDTTNHTLINDIRIKNSPFHNEDILSIGNKKLNFKWIEEQILICDQKLKTDFKEEFQNLKDLYNQHITRMQKIEQKLTWKNRLPHISLALIPATVSFLPIIQKNAVLQSALITSSAAIIPILFGQKSKKINTEKENELRKFKYQYVCPKCGNQFGNLHYEDIEHQKYCSKCKAKFV